METKKDDKIYRQAAIDAICAVCGNDCDKSEFVYNAPQDEQVILCPEHYVLCALPPVQPERKTGKWIKIPKFCGDDVSGFIDNHFTCSECKKEATINLWGFYILSDFCPNCGADMRGE